MKLGCKFITKLLKIKVLFDKLRRSVKKQRNKNISRDKQGNQVVYVRADSDLSPTAQVVSFASSQPAEDVQFEVGKNIKVPVSFNYEPALTV